MTTGINNSTLSILLSLNGTFEENVTKSGCALGYSPSNVQLTTIPDGEGKTLKIITLVHNSSIHSKASVYEFGSIMKVSNAKYNFFIDPTVLQTILHNH